MIFTNVEFASFVVAWLPDSDNRAVGLDLVNVATFDPDTRRSHNGCRNDRGRCRDHCRRSYDRWRRHNRRSGDNHRRWRYGIVENAPHDSSNDSAYKAWPEVAPAATPVGMMMVHWSGTWTRTAVEAAMMVHPGTWTRTAVEAAVVRTGKSTYGQYRRSDCYYEFLVHVEPSFLVSFCKARNYR